MKIGLISSTLPNPKFGGGSVTIYSMLMAIRNLSKDVTLIVLDESSLSKKTERIYLNQGIKIEYLKRSQNQSFFLRKMKVFFPFLFKFNGLYDHKYQFKNDFSLTEFKVIFAYHWEAINFLSKLKKVYKIGLAGDPINYSLAFRYQRNIREYNISFKRKAYLLYRNAITNYSLQRSMVNTLNKMNESGLFASHHAMELNSLGASECKYINTPVSLNLKDKKIYKRQIKTFNILMVGHLAGISTLEGINLFFNEILPEIKIKLKNDFIVTIVGKYDHAEPRVINQLKREKSIKLLGNVDNLAQQYEDSDLILVPTPITLGIRVRILTAMMYGKLIIAHNSNKQGIPELENEYNCLLGCSGEELSEHIISVYKYRNGFNTISDNALKTYEKYFKPNSFSQRYSNILNQK